MTTFTIGFLGRYRYTSSMQDYVDSIILNYLCRQEILVVMVHLNNIYAQQIAERVLTIRRICPSIKLRVVLTDDNRKGNGERTYFPAAVNREKIIGQADLIDRLTVDMSLALHERLSVYFLHNSDLIVYSPYRMSKAVKQDFRNRLRRMKLHRM